MRLSFIPLHYSSNQYCILYFFYLKNQIVLAHAFAKKTQQLPESDIRLAEQRMEDWIGRISIGGEYK
ncbi:MAG: type II toxin-antitoxin system RelE/ParE family toxin [Nitrospirae bacterium]|nr:type II toxin-antitoxin system RelE/ParE family toxin [Nitrospirota bacterium]